MAKRVVMFLLERKMLSWANLRAKRFPIPLTHWFPEDGHQNHPRTYLYRLLGLPHTVSDSVGLPQGPQIFISNKFLGDAHGAGPDQFGKPCSNAAHFAFTLGLTPAHSLP